MPPHVLNVKVNQVIILLRNINIRLGLCNGTRMRVLRLHDNLVEAVCIKTGQRAFIPRMPLTSEMDNFPFKLKRLQFQFRPGYAMTGNRGQGQTIDRLGIYMPRPFFAHGQLYTSFSRIRNQNNIKALILDTPSQGRMTLNPRLFFTQNVVYRKLLSPQLPLQPVVRLDAPNLEQLRQAEERVDVAVVNHDFANEMVVDEVDGDFERELDDRLAEQDRQEERENNEQISVQVLQDQDEEHAFSQTLSQLSVN
jgi:hypothetical protein